MMGILKHSGQVFPGCQSATVLPCIGRGKSQINNSYFIIYYYISWSAEECGFFFFPIVALAK